MAFIDYQARTIEAKVVYFGPEGSGKTSHLAYLFERAGTPDAKRILLASDPGAKTYDYLPVNLGSIRGFSTKFHLYTVPGGADSFAARGALLERVDGIVFVADAAAPREVNLASWQELKHLLSHYGFALEAMPRVVALNKSDLAERSSWSASRDATFFDAFGVSRLSLYDSVATTGAGVFDALRDLAKQILLELRQAAPPP